MVVPSILNASLSGTRRLMAQSGSTAACEGRTNRPGADSSYSPEADLAQCNCGKARRQDRWSCALGIPPLDSSLRDRLHFLSGLTSVSVSIALFREAVVKNFRTAP